MLSSISLEAALILLREGLEAMLVLAALAALLRRLAPERMGALWAGAGGGLLASLGTAVAYAAWRDGVHNDLVEAATSLTAAGLMLWTGGWLWRRADPRNWALALQRQAQAALGATRVPLALAGIGFLAVFREGAETALFLAGLGGAPLALGGGLVLGGIGLVALGWMILRAAVRLPLRALFRATSVFLLVMAARMVGAGLREFQEQALVPFDPAEIPDWAASLGLSGSWEGILLQAGVLAAVALVLVWPGRSAPAQVAAAE